MGKPIILELIPGFNEALREAERAEADTRELPYLDAPIMLCGFRVRHFTPNHRAILANAKNPFIIGGEKEASHVALFLWVVSETFDPSEGSFLDMFLEDCILKIDDFFGAKREIERYVNLAFQDRPGSGGGGASSPITCSNANIVHALAGAYGWPEAVILAMPYAKIFQHLRLIMRDDAAAAGRKMHFSSATLRLRREWSNWAIAEAEKEAHE